MKQSILILFILSSISCNQGENSSGLMPGTESDLRFTLLPTTWDEAIPIGNGMLGALIWEKGNRLRFSIDRADLWDLRPMENLDKPEWKYSWVKEQWDKNKYSTRAGYVRCPL